MMRSILEEWDSSIFFYGGDIRQAGYRDEQYKLMGYECKQDFEEDDFFKEFHYPSVENLGSMNGVGRMLTEEDKRILIEHSDYLFNGIKEEEKLYKYMLKLALYLNRYRYLGTRKKTIKKLQTKIRKTPKKHHAEREKIEKIKSLAEQLILLMGGKYVSHGLITEELNKVIESPHLYIAKLLNPKTLLVSEIKKYLSNLKLRKQDEINNFITDISNI